MFGYNGGTQSSFMSTNNRVLNANSYTINQLYSTGGGKGMSSVGMIPNASNASKIRFFLTQSVAGLQTVDFVHRELDLALGNDMIFGDNTFSGISQFDVVAGDSIVIDVTNHHNRNIGICAFKLDQTYFAGKSIYLFTSGTTSNLQMFAVEVDGTITELTKTEAVMNTSISEELKG